MKRCFECKLVKSPGEFYKNRARPDGLCTYCKPCSADRLMEWLKLKGPAQKRRIARCVRMKRWRLAGWTPEAFEAAKVSQGGRCAICSVRLRFEGPQTGDRAVADHCHASAVPRGILCRNCNIALGHFKDNSAVLAKAIEYLARYGLRRVG